MLFKQLFGRDPNYETCSCCGNDYSISESDTLEEASKYHREDDYRLKGKKLTVEEYITKDNVLVVHTEIVMVPTEVVVDKEGILTKVKGLHKKNRRR